jgi:nucleoside phosphorylase
MNAVRSSLVIAPFSHVNDPGGRIVTTPMEAVLDRITFEPKQAELKPIPWPEKFKPAPQHTKLGPGGTLPSCDVLVITWTAAEAAALADVLSPGVTSKQWLHYKNKYSSYLPDLTNRSPAKDAKRLGEFCVVEIGDLTVCLFHSQLHPATDGPSCPTITLAAQLTTEATPKLVITTGTAGAAAEGNLLGDVTVGSAVRSWFTKGLKGHPWSEEQWATTPLTDGQKARLAPDALAPLFAANAGRLPARYATRPPQVWYGTVVSTDWFCYGSDNDACGLTTYCPQVSVCEMDDAAVMLGVLTETSPPMFEPPAVMAIRNSSDPVLPDGTPASLKLAEDIYRADGLFTTWNSAICVWAVIAGLDQGNDS